MTSLELKRKYNVPVYRNWNDIPQNLHTRTSSLRCGVVIPVDAKPDAIKNAASVNDKNKIYFLYDINKYNK